MDRLDEVERHARDILEDFPDTRTYHDSGHVESVVEMAHELGEERGLSNDELELLLTAAWFHDLGYATGPMDGHEGRSAQLVDERLADTFTDAERDRIKTAIEATIWSREPTTELGCLLVDADLSSLGTDAAERARQDFFDELQQTESYNLTWDRYLDMRVELFDDYTFNTPEGRNRFQAQKDETIASLKDEQ